MDRAGELPDERFWYGAAGAQWQLTGHTGVQSTNPAALASAGLAIPDDNRVDLDHMIGTLEKLREEAQGRHKGAEDAGKGDDRGDGCWAWWRMALNREGKYQGELYHWERLPGERD
ncbi:hypothetical protein PG985_009739 [Apiospora marii]|uniref:uncharacterized protein n=1 Tax=Apiospora marii TaxID=335849 RepID=UPI00312DA0B7